MKEEPRDLPPVACTALLGDPFVVLSLDQIRDVRNEAINHINGDSFNMHGFTFLMPVALFRANSRLMMESYSPNPTVDHRPTGTGEKQ